MARKLLSTLDLPYEDWIALRKKSIGGSDAATIVGLNPWSSQYVLWADKMGLLPEKEDSEAMRQGRDFEDYVARRWMAATDKKCRRTNYMYLHDDYDFISANIDREVVGENAGLECKTTSVYNKSDFERGEIPLNYYVQCMHYMAVMGYDRMYLAVLVLNKGFYDFVVERDENEINALITKEKAFWEQHMVGEQAPPDIDGSEATENAIRTIYPQEEDADSVPLDGLDVNMLLRIREAIADLAGQEAEVKNRIMTALGAHEAGYAGNTKITWQAQSSNRVDTKILKGKYPDIYQDVIQSYTNRVFRIKEAK